MPYTQRSRTASPSVASVVSSSVVCCRSQQQQPPSSLPMSLPLAAPVSATQSQSQSRPAPMFNYFAPHTRDQDQAPVPQNDFQDPVPPGGDARLDDDGSSIRVQTQGGDTEGTDECGANNKDDCENNPAMLDSSSQGSCQRGDESVHSRGPMEANDDSDTTARPDKESHVCEEKGRGEIEQRAQSVADIISVRSAAAPVSEAPPLAQEKAKCTAQGTESHMMNPSPATATAVVQHRQHFCCCALSLCRGQSIGYAFVTYPDKFEEQNTVADGGEEVNRGHPHKNVAMQRIIGKTMEVDTNAQSIQRTSANHTTESLDPSTSPTTRTSKGSEISIFCGELAVQNSEDHARMLSYFFRALPRPPQYQGLVENTLNVSVVIHPAAGRVFMETVRQTVRCEMEDEAVMRLSAADEDADGNEHDSDSAGHDTRHGSTSRTTVKHATNANHSTSSNNNQPIRVESISFSSADAFDVGRIQERLWRLWPSRSREEWACRIPFDHLEMVSALSGLLSQLERRFPLPPPRPLGGIGGGRGYGMFQHQQQPAYLRQPTRGAGTRGGFAGAYPASLLSTSIASHSFWLRADVRPHSIEHLLMIPRNAMDGMQIFRFEAHPAAIHGLGRPREGLSIFSLLNKARSSMGRTTLRRWCLLPTSSADVIQPRLHALRELVRPRHRDLLVELIAMFRFVRDVSKMCHLIRAGRHTVSLWQSVLMSCRAAERIVALIGPLAHPARNDGGDTTASATDHQGVVVEAAAAVISSVDLPALRQVIELITVTVDFGPHGSGSGGTRNGREGGHHHRGAGNRNKTNDQNNKLFDHEEITVKSGVDTSLDEYRQAYAQLDTALTVVAQREASLLPPSVNAMLVMAFFPQLGYVAQLSKQPQSSLQSGGSTWGSGAVANRISAAAITECPYDLPSDWELAFQTSDGWFFKSPAARELDVSLGDIHAAMVERQGEVIREFEGVVLQHSVALSTMSAPLGELDALCAMAMTAIEEGWSCPTLGGRSDPLILRQCRHPLLTRSGAVASQHGAIPFSFVVPGSGTGCNVGVIQEPAEDVPPLRKDSSAADQRDRDQSRASSQCLGQDGASTSSSTSKVTTVTPEEDYHRLETTVTEAAGLPDPARVTVVTGANGSGKSVLLRAVALSVYLAHIGSFVPCEFALIPPCDAIYTNDCLSLDTLVAGGGSGGGGHGNSSNFKKFGRGGSASAAGGNVGAAMTSAPIVEVNSSFGQELAHVGSAVRGSTASSLVLLDEFGAGTLAVDGVALFGGLVKHFVGLGRAAPIVLCATHFTEIFQRDLIDPTDRRDGHRMAWVAMRVWVVPVPITGNDGTSDESVRTLSVEGEGVVGHDDEDGAPSTVIETVAVDDDSSAQQQQQSASAHHSHVSHHRDDQDHPHNDDNEFDSNVVFLFTPGVGGVGVAHSNATSCARAAGMPAAVTERAVVLMAWQRWLLFHHQRDTNGDQGWRSTTGCSARLIHAFLSAYFGRPVTRIPRSLLIDLYQSHTRHHHKSSHTINANKVNTSDPRVEPHIGKHTSTPRVATSAGSSLSTHPSSQQLKARKTPFITSIHNSTNVSATTFMTKSSAAVTSYGIPPPPPPPPSTLGALNKRRQPPSLLYLKK